MAARRDLIVPVFAFDPVTIDQQMIPDNALVYGIVASFHSAPDRYRGHEHAHPYPVMLFQHFPHLGYPFGVRELIDRRRRDDQELDLAVLVEASVRIAAI